MVVCERWALWFATVPPPSLMKNSSPLAVMTSLGMRSRTAYTSGSTNANIWQPEGRAVHALSCLCGGGEVQLPRDVHGVVRRQRPRPAAVRLVKVVQLRCVSDGGALDWVHWGSRPAGLQRDHDRHRGAAAAPMTMGTRPTMRVSTAAVSHDVQPRFDAPSTTNWLTVSACSCECGDEARLRTLVRAR